MKAVSPFVLAACAALCSIAAPAPFARAQSDAPAAIGGKTVALSVTGEGKASVKPDGFYLNVVFYNDASNSDAAAAQNVQTETALMQAAEQAGISAGNLKFPEPRKVGFPSNNSYVVAIEVRPVRAGEAARAVRTLFISGSRFSLLPSLIANLQKVNASGFIKLSYGYDNRKATRTQTLKDAVSDAITQARTLEAASLPRKLYLLAMEPGEFSDASHETTFPLSPPKETSGAATSGAAASVSAPLANTHQSVTLRYALADAPPAKAVTKTAIAAKKP